MDKLTSMRVFTKVAKTGSFAAAARELGISRAMTTKHVMHLENHLSARLLNRTTRSLSITEVGASYLERCQEILDQIEETELAVTQLHTEPRGVLKINAPAFFGAYHLAPAIADYRKLYPDVTFDMVFQGGVVDLVEEGLDLAIRLDPLTDSSLIARKLASSNFVVCGAPKYLDQHGVPETPADLKHHNCLINWGLPPGNQWSFSRPGAEVSVKISGTLQSNVADAVRVAALEGIGLAILPTYMVGRDLQKGKLRAVLIDHQPRSLDIHMVYPHRKHLSAKVRTFANFLAERLQPRPYWDDWMDADTPVEQLEQCGHLF